MTVALSQRALSAAPPAEDASDGSDVGSQGQASRRAPFSEAYVAALGARFEVDPAQEVVRWACDLFGARLSLVCSFQNCVLIDLVTRIDPTTEVIFLDTGSHFAETYRFVERVRDLYSLNLRVIRPGGDAKASPCGSRRCCELRKVIPLNSALKEREAWMTGLKRVDTPARATTPVVEWDAARAMVKVNPIVRWDYDEVARYEVSHHLPTHPLKGQGYLSIGCRPTTRPVSQLEDPRAGRWPGTEKTECGLHF